MQNGLTDCYKKNVASQPIKSVCGVKALHHSSTCVLYTRYPHKHVREKRTHKKEHADGSGVRLA